MAEKTTRVTKIGSLEVKRPRGWVEQRCPFAVFPTHPDYEPSMLDCGDWYPHFYVGPSVHKGVTVLLSCAGGDEDLIYKDVEVQDG